MSDEDKINKYHNDSQRANEANYVLTNPLFMESFEIVESSLMKQLIGTQSNETELREELYRRIQLLKDVETVLIRTLKTGKIAQEKLSYLERAKRLAGL